MRWVLLIVLALHVGLRTLVEKKSNLQAHRYAKLDNPNLIRNFEDTSLARKFHYSLDPRVLKYISFGYKNVIADALWLRFIQGMDILVVDRKSKGWLYQMLKGITTLDPKFRIAYSAGGVWLSVIRQDVEGAEDILESGLEEFPQDWNIHLNLLYHHLYETKNRSRALEVAQAAQKLPEAPDYIVRLIGSLLASEKKYDESIAFLENQIKNAEHPVQKEAYIEKLKMIIATRDQGRLTELLNKNFPRGWPSSWSAVIDKKLLSQIPRDPLGEPYLIFPQTHEVKSSKIQTKSYLE